MNKQRINSDPYGAQLVQGYSHNSYNSRAERRKAVASWAGKFSLQMLTFGMYGDMLVGSRYADKKWWVASEWNQMTAGLTNLAQAHSKRKLNAQQVAATHNALTAQERANVEAGSMTEALARIAEASRLRELRDYELKMVKHAEWNVSATLSSISSAAGEIVGASRMLPEMFGGKQQAAAARAALREAKRVIYPPHKRGEQPRIKFLTGDTINHLSETLQDVPASTPEGTLVRRALYHDLLRATAATARVLDADAARTNLANCFAQIDFGSEGTDVQAWIDEGVTASLILEQANKQVASTHRQ